MTVAQYLHVEEAQFLNSAFPQFKRFDGTSFPIAVLAFDAASDEAAFWKFRLEGYTSGNITIDIEWYADTASANSVVWEAMLAAITPNIDSQDVETKSFGALSFVQSTHLGTTGQRLHRATIILTDINSAVADDAVWLRIARDADSTSATDDMTGDAHLTSVRLSYL